jgi:hypothetical protein
MVLDAGKSKLGLLHLVRACLLLQLMVKVEEAMSPYKRDKTKGLHQFIILPHDPNTSTEDQTST